MALHAPFEIHNDKSSLELFVSILFLVIQYVYESIDASSKTACIT